LTCITGGIAEAFYGIPEEIAEKSLSLLDDFLCETTVEFRKKYF
jgi:type I restriction enzyme M protein